MLRLDEYKNLDNTKAFPKLQKSKQNLSLKELLSEKRIQQASIKAGGGLHFNYAAKIFNQEILDNLQDLSDELDLCGQYKQLLAGKKMNNGEERYVLHQLARAGKGKECTEILKEYKDFFLEQRERIKDFSKRVQKGEIKSSTGQKFDTVVQIGIGGSDLGPRALYLALKNRYPQKLKAEFVSNVDPDDLNEVFQRINPESSLVVVVSKSGTTQETRTNENLAREFFKQKAPQINSDQHFIAVTSKDSPMDDKNKYRECFYINDFIGGRYSSTSAVGGVILSLALGNEVFENLLKGAAEADILAENPDIKQNAALMDALLGVYERNILNFSATAILPYTQALSRFPAHLQQLDMESNGKSVNRAFEKVPYQTGPLIFGEPGTNGQHSFYQLLHQGTDIVPLQFIAFKNSQSSFDPVFEEHSSRVKLNANLFAQITAFASGQESPENNKLFEGERPSSLIHAEDLNAESLGALLAHYENKVMFQGFIWNINSFDQEGVQLGKKLTNELLSGKSKSNLLKSYFSLFY